MIFGYRQGQINRKYVTGMLESIGNTDELFAQLYRIPIVC
jgi:hypothetical protein